MADHQAGHHFISYSPVEAKDFAIKLCDELLAGPPSIPAWLDKRELRPGEDWDEQIVEAIRTCESLIFVMTTDSVESQSVCKQEWTRALQYKKPIIPVLLHHDAIMPFRLGSRQYIDFTGRFDVALARLRNHLQWLASPKGELRALQDRLADAQWDLRRANTPEQEARIQGEIEELQEEIAHQQCIVENPEEAKRGVEDSIQRGLEAERESADSATVTTPERVTVINYPPVTARDYFQDRHVETRVIADFLSDDATRLMTVIGRGGMGKTTVACRLLKSLESGRLPDDGGELDVDGIVYLSEEGTRRVNVPNLYADLCKLLPDDVAGRLENLYKDPQADTEAKMQALLEAFPDGRYVLLLDNFERVLDPETREIRDGELDEALRALLSLPHHAVKVILTTRFAPRGLARVHPERRQLPPLNLKEGLPSPYAENILREMDGDGRLGLKTAPEELLDEARLRTGGNPRALEHLFAILSEDWDTSLGEILDETGELPPEEVSEVLVGEAFGRLDAAARMVMQALAVYGRPVPPVAVDYLLQPHLLGVDSAPVLRRLVNMQLVRREEREYYLHEIDRKYAFSRVPEGEVADRGETEAPPFTQYALLERAADYFVQVRTPQETWKSIEDLAPQLAEFDLRYAGEDYDVAAGVLLDIDFDYLMLWGHSRLAIELHEDLRGKVNDRQLQGQSLGKLGTAYQNTGQVQEAITCHGQALEITREIGDRKGEGRRLGSLGNSYYALGQTKRAIEYYEKALGLAREIEDRKGEGRRLGSLGVCYSYRGQTELAIDYYKKALEIAQEIGDRKGEGVRLGNLGLRYSALGKTEWAMEHYEQALEIARELGHRGGEAFRLENIGQLLIREGEFDKAVQKYEAAIRIADEIGYSRAQNEAQYSLALAYLYAGDLTAARAAAQDAWQYDVPKNNANVRALLGVLALRQGDRSAAREAFEAAVSQSEELLSHGEQNYAALDTKALALCEENSDRISAARDAYRSAREINSDAGIVGDVLRLFDALAKADPAGMVAGVRATAARE